jgi:polysaccharide biosynthesis transport protein
MKETREIIATPPIEKVELDRVFVEPQIPITTAGYRGGYDQESSQILDYWRAIRKRLWLVIGVTVLITTLTAIYMARRPDIYQAQATVQVDLEQANPDLAVSERRSSSLNPDPAYFNTQLQLLTSESLLRRVVKELSLDSNKEFQKNKAEGSVSAWRSMLKAVGLASDVPKKKETVEEVTVSNSSSVASNEEIAEAVRLAPFVDAIRKNINVEPVREARATFKDTRLIEIYYRHTDPELAAVVVNGVAGTFSKQNQEKRTGTNRKNNEFLDERIANLQTEIKAGEEKLVETTKRYGILKTDENQTIVLERLAGLNKQLLEAEEQRKNAEANYNEVEKSPERLKSLVEAESVRYFTERENEISKLVNENQKQITALKVNRTRLAEEYHETVQEIVEIDKQIKTLEDEIVKVREANQKALDDFRKRTAKVMIDNLRTRYLQAKSQEDKIKADFDKQYSEAQGEETSAITIRLLQQDVDTKKGFLKNLIEQQSVNDITGSGTENNVGIVEIAIPPDAPVSPRRLSTVLAALLLSSLFGAGLALVLEYLDDTIRNTEEVEKYLGLPALAAIPTIDSMPRRRLLLVGANDDGDSKGNSELLINMDSRSSLAEAYRQLRTSILLSTAGHAPKSLLITSSLPSEGKTTTAINTAISLAQTGAKVLIIDSDMRRPRLHTVFNISNAEGLSTILSSDLNGNEILDVIQKDELTKLNLLPSGPVPPNPAELIGSEQMANLLKLLQNNFTHVVVDSPPIASFTDGVLIASMVDGVILVVNSGKSSRQVVRRSRQLLQDIGAKIFGVVLNNVNLRSQDNYYYYQSYYHRDNYRHDSDE